MIEIMAVIVIIGILAGIVAVSVVGKIDKARVISTKASLKMLHSAVIQFKLDTGRYPTEEAGLQELIEQPTDVTGWNTGGYLETTSLPKDAWGNDFVYQLLPESGKPFVIISYGANGEEGGEGYDADLYSTDAQ
jgi:general secretion pathway protein G